MMNDSVDLVIAVSWKPEKNEFLSALGVNRGGLGEHFFGNVFDALFTTSINVSDEFTKYYSVEYSDLREYLEIRYGQTITDEEMDAKYIFLVKHLPQIVDSDYANNKLDTVLECVNKLNEAYNENQT